MNQHVLNIIKKYQWAVGGAMVLMVVLWLTYSLLVPNISKYEAIKSSNTSRQKKMADMLGQISKFETLNTQQYERDLVNIIRVLPSEKDFLSAFDRVDQLQRSSGVTIDSLTIDLGSVSTVSAAKKADQYGSYLALSLSVRGTSEQLKTFLSKTNDFSGRIIIVSNIKSGIKNSGDIQSHLEAKMYFGALKYADSDNIQLSQAQQTVMDKILASQAFFVQTEDTGVVGKGKKNLFTR